MHRGHGEIRIRGQRRRDIRDREPNRTGRQGSVRIENQSRRHKQRGRRRRRSRLAHRIVRGDCVLILVDGIDARTVRERRRSGGQGRLIVHDIQCRVGTLQDHIRKLGIGHVQIHDEGCVTGVGGKKGHLRLGGQPGRRDGRSRHSLRTACEFVVGGDHILVTDIGPDIGVRVRAALRVRNVTAHRRTRARERLACQTDIVIRRTEGGETEGDGRRRRDGGDGDRGGRERVLTALVKGIVDLHTGRIHDVAQEPVGVGGRQGVAPIHPYGIHVLGRQGTLINTDVVHEPVESIGYIKNIVGNHPIGSKCGGCLRCWPLSRHRAHENPVQIITVEGVGPVGRRVIISNAIGHHVPRFGNDPVRPRHVLLSRARRNVQPVVHALVRTLDERGSLRRRCQHKNKRI